VSALEIVDVGWSTTIQDVGRTGHAAIGVPPSGALDEATRDLLNRLVGNPPDAAVLETAGRLRVRAVGACTVALSSELAPRAVNDGEVVQVDPADTDLWGYVAARGGFDVPAVPVRVARTRCRASDRRHWLPGSDCPSVAIPEPPSSSTRQRASSAGRER
jgi:Carboxyltransferase domain, subdomain A and B